MRKRENLSGFWSRRINDEHRIVYAVEKEMAVVISCKGHYN
ncbi:type II toxin-antitoxin system YoeB family toxin [Lachnospiraceae bacterium 48-42]|nr:type II toxin-antitoxin system YoeB family toxin [Dorea sp.]